MIIELRQPVQVRLEDGKFVTLPVGLRVNYSGEAKSGKFLHRFTCIHKKPYQTVTHITVTEPKENPPWL